MSLTDLLRSKHADFLALAPQHGASNVDLLGSEDCGDACEDADVDPRVTSSEARSAWLPLGSIRVLVDLRKAGYLDSTIPSYLFDQRDSIKSYIEVTKKRWAMGFTWPTLHFTRRIFF